jgi:hypothetical protein
MTFQDKAKDQASERFFLVKFTPRRYLGIGSFEAPQSYRFTVPENLNINSIVINGNAILSSAYSYAADQLLITSPTINATAMVDGQYYVIKTVGTTNYTLYGAASNTVGIEFKANLQTATPTGTGTVYQDLSEVYNVCCLDHDIFVTGTKQRATSGVSGIPDAIWEPLILNYPGFSQSMRNIAEGVFSLSGSELELICTNRWAQSLVGKPEDITGQYESLSSCPISVWACIDSAQYNRKIFDGEIVSFAYRYGKVNLQIIDTFQKLGNTASFGTREQSEIFNGNKFYNVTAKPEPSSQNKKIPITLGKSSPFSVSLGYSHVDSFGNTNLTQYHITNGQDALLISATTPTSKSTWIGGRMVSQGLKLINFGTFTGVAAATNYKKTITGTKIYDDGSANDGKSEPITRQIYNTILWLQLADLNQFNGEIGDIIPASFFDQNYQKDGFYPFKNIECGVICGYGENLYFGYNLGIYIVVKQGANFIISSPTPDDKFLDAITFPNNVIPSVSIWVEGDETADYDFDEIIKPAGQIQTIWKFNKPTKYVSYSSIEGFIPYQYAGENVWNFIFKLDPIDDQDASQAKIKCRFSPSQSLSHADALKFVIKSAGMAVNDASFAQAETDLAANVSLTIPNSGGEFPTYLEVAQSITRSTLGILRVNNAREVEYEIIKNPEAMAVDGVRDSINMLADQTDARVDYQDLVSQVKFENPQLKNIAALSNAGPNAVVDFPIVKQVHRVDKIKTIQHVLENIAPRKDAIAGYFSNPTVEYNLSTASEDLASSIGDVIELNNTAVAGKDQTTRGVIISLDQSGSTTKVKINEIRGVD